MLEQLIGSLVAFLHNLWPVKSYQLENPIEPEIPSFYVPAPISTGSRYSKDSYENSYSFNVKIFCNTTREALLQADKLATTVRKSRFNISLNNLDGTPSQEIAEVLDVSTDILDDGVAVMRIDFQIINDFE